jgi:hypothetical protein
MKARIRSCWLFLWLALVAAQFGCASTDSDNAAARPWNAPQNWEHGLPPSMMEGR